MEPGVIAMAEDFLGKKNVYPLQDQAGAYLLIKFDGNTQEELEPIVEQASEILLENGAIDVFVADTPDLKKNAWGVRGATLDGILASTSAVDECDVVVPRNKIAEYIEKVYELKDKHNVRIISNGHAGDGNLHIYACKDDIPEELWPEKCKAVLDDMYKMAAEIGGQVSGEHGIGHAKIEYLEESVGPVNMALMEGIKKAFDPNGILNPGKVCYKL